MDYAYPVEVPQQAFNPFRLAICTRDVPNRKSRHKNGHEPIRHKNQGFFFLSPQAQISELTALADSPIHTEQQNEYTPVQTDPIFTY
jgi:hypothetical protein